MNEWRALAVEQKNAGYTYFDQLGGRRVGDQIELLLSLINPTTFDATVIKTQIPNVDEMVSLSDLWAGAKWCEAEIRHLFRRAAPLLTPSGPVAQTEERS